MRDPSAAVAGHPDVAILHTGRQVTAAAVLLWSKTSWAARICKVFWSGLSEFSIRAQIALHGARTRPFSSMRAERAKRLDPAPIDRALDAGAGEAPRRREESRPGLLQPDEHKRALIMAIDMR